MKPGPDWKRYIVWSDCPFWGWDPVEDFDDFDEAYAACEKYEYAYVEDTGGN